MKDQELKTKTSTQTLIYKIFLQRYQVYQGRLLASFQDDAKYEHVDNDTRSQGNIVTNSRVTPSWREIVSLTFSEAGVLHVNWTSFGHCVSRRASTFVPPPENSLLSQTGDIGVFIDWFCKKQGITELTPEHLEGPAYEVVKAFHLNGDRLALSITKMKAASYPDVGLEQMVPDQMWAEEEYMYDISASYGISHWWFKRQQFYIDRHSADTNRRAIVRTHMRILSVVRIEVFSVYGYDYMKKIVLRRTDIQEYTIAESDFKDLYPSDFEDLYLLNLQGHLNHLPPKDNKILSTAVNLWIRNLVIRKRVEDFQLGIESYQTQLNLTKPRWEATGLKFMHDYKILDSPRAVVFRDRYGMQMIMRFNEIHMFSDGTLQQIDEALDYRVKELKVNKSYKDGNVRYLFPRSRQSRRDLPRDNPLVSVEVLRSVLTDPEVTPTRLGRIVICFISGSSKDGDGDTSFQWSQFTTPCSHLIFLINDIMTTKRPTTQLPEMLDDFNKQDVMDPHRLVKERVHVLLMDNEIAIHMMIEKKYPLTQEMLSRMLNRRLEVDHESEMTFELLRFTRSQLKK
ncbi:hypothetical protein Tco_1504328 [Tanacetum coccineum]